MSSFRNPTIIGVLNSSVKAGSTVYYMKWAFRGKINMTHLLFSHSNCILGSKVIVNSTSPVYVKKKKIIKNKENTTSQFLMFLFFFTQLFLTFFTLKIP